MPANHDRHATVLRGILKAERERRGWSLRHTAELVARELGRDKLSKQSLQDWEEGTFQPRMEAFSAWARVLGFRLFVELVPGADLVPLHVPATSVALISTLLLLPPADLQVVETMINRLKPQP